MHIFFFLVLKPYFRIQSNEAKQIFNFLSYPLFSLLISINVRKQIFFIFFQREIHIEEVCILFQLSFSSTTNILLRQR